MIWMQEAMGFIREPDSYYNAALSDLLGAWANLREEVLKAFGFPKSPSGAFPVDNPNQLTKPDQ